MHRVWQRQSAGSAPGAGPVAFFLPHLGGGGAEMNTVRLANELAVRGLRVSLLVVRGGGSYEPLVAPSVQLVVLGGRAVASSTAALLLAMPALRRWVARHHPAVLVPVMDLPAVVASLALHGLAGGPRLIPNIQNNPDAKARQGRVLRAVIALSRRLYPRAEAIVALSRGVADSLQRRIPALAGRLRVIPNIGYGPELPARVREPIPERAGEGRRLIVAAGRLVEQKGYPVLLEALARLQGRVDFECWILGRGVLEPVLRARIAELGLESRVRLLGFRANPYAYMAAADLFVLSSLWEGFGNVLVEAMASGTAVVSTDCPYGPGEIIRDGISGCLVPPGDAAALGAAIERVLGDEPLRQRLIAGGRVRARNFDADVITSQWLSLLGVADAAARPRSRRPARRRNR